LPEGALALAANNVSPVRAAEVRHGRGIFWGVQYHPELSLFEVAARSGASPTTCSNAGSQATRQR
jgi:GMP synthase (glutamine-hydrolysing)